MNTLTPKESSDLSQTIYSVTRVVSKSNYKDPNSSQFLKEYKLKEKGEILDSFSSNAFNLHDFFNANTGYGYHGGYYQNTTFGCMAKGIDNGKINRSSETLIAIKGTSSWADAETDLKTLPTSLDGHMVHRGFVQTFRSFEHHIDRYLDWHSPSRIHLVGHSLGGALATLTAYHIAKRDSAKTCQIKLYTFGAPRVGFTSFNQEVDKLIGKQNIYRVYHDADLVSMVPMFPFLHIPSSDFFDGYKLDWTSGLVSVQAHFMDNYIATIRNAEWGNIKGSISQKKVMNWLDGIVHAGIGFVMLSAPLLSLITIGLHLILQNIHKLGISSQLPSYSTPLDTLAWLLYRGAAAAIKMSMWVKNLLKGIMTFLGEPMIHGQSLSVIFIRYVLSRLVQTIMRLAKQSLEASQMQMQIALPRTLWQAPEGHPTPSGLRPRQNAYRVPGPNNRLGGKRGPLAL